MADKPDSTKTKTKTDEEVKPDKSDGNKKGLLWGIIGGVLFVVALVLGFLFLRPKPAADDPKNSPSYSSAFFIYANGGYSLWNKDGVRLTPDTYDDKSNFIGGYAYVKKGNEYAILSETGVMTMEFGKISRVINAYAGLFLVEDNSGARMLIKGKGDVLLTGDNLSVDAANNTAAFLVAELDNNYYVYNYAGKLVMQFAKANDDESVKLSSSKDFALVYYNGSNLLFDARTGQQLALFEADRYSIDDVTEDRSMVLLAKYDDDDGGEYKLATNGKLYDLNEKMFYGLVRNSNMLVGFDDSYDKVALLDSEFKVVKEVPADVAIKDVNNFVAMNEDGVIEVCQNGNMTKSLGEGKLASGVLAGVDLYAIRLGEGGKYGFYHLDGSFAFGEYEDVYGLFNKFHHAAVSDDGDNYYLVDANGRRLNDVNFRRMYTYDNSYLVTNEDGKRAIMATDGAMVTGFDYTEAYNRSVAVDHEIWSLKKEANKYDVVDVTAQNKFILTDVNTYDFSANYFVVKNSDDKKEFYTYSGLKFYTEE